MINQSIKPANQNLYKKLITQSVGKVNWLQKVKSNWFLDAQLFLQKGHKFDNTS